MYNSSDSVLLGYINFLGLATVGTTASTSAIYYKPVESSSSFTGISFTLEVINTGTTVIGGITYNTGDTSGVTATYSGTSYSDVENRIVVLLRSRANYDGSENLNFELSADTIGFDSTVTAATLNSSSPFTLTGTALTYGAFSYNCSMDNTSNSYILNVLGEKAFDKKVAIFVEEIYSGMFDSFVADGKVRGLHLTLINYADSFENYKEQYQSSYSPYLLSEINGSKIMKLFRFKTISDGNGSSKEIKISIANIKPDDKTFSVFIRSFYDTDARPVILESYASCTLDPNSNGFIARKIGTVDGEFPQNSNYVLLELDTENDTSNSFPSGFMGYPTKDFTLNSNTSVQNPRSFFKQTYGVYENKRKFYLGESDTVGIDEHLYSYNGLTTGDDPFTGLTHSFHMDVNASGITSVDGITVVFDTGNAPFQTEAGLLNTDVYEKVYARKFTFCVYGGYDGWDIYRKSRTNTDSYILSGTKGQLGLTKGNFSNYVMDDGENGLTSDYYAYLKAFQLLSNPEAQNINILAPTGIDTINNSLMIEEVISIAEDYRRDSVVPLITPDVDSNGDAISEEDVVNSLDGNFDTNYCGTFYPNKQYLDSENNVYVWLSVVSDYVRNCGFTDRVAFPWYAVAGVDRGVINCVRMRKKLTQTQRDILYEGRINPCMFLSSYSGYRIWGNRNLQSKDTALNRLNIRRLLLQAEKICSVSCLKLLFGPNDAVTLNEFMKIVNPILSNIQKQRGLIDFRVIADNSSSENVEQHILTAQLYIKPSTSLEGIYISFNLTNQGASFENI